MAVVLELEGRAPISYASAANKDGNIINELAYVPARKKLYQKLCDETDTICSLVRHHLQLSYNDVCAVAPQSEWICGSFNVCVPIEVMSDTACRKLMLRCCLPYKLAEGRYPGTVDEKLGCEVGTYAWMQRNCPDIRIPHLFGFGFSDHRHFTHEAHRPWYIRILRMFQRRLDNLLWRRMLSRYTQNPTDDRLPTAYMLLEHIGPDVGQMLSNTWDCQRGDSNRRKRLFQGMAHIILSLARIPQPRIGSFRFHDDCSVTLTNRPLTCSMIILENDGTPRAMQGTETYSCTDAFVSDMLTLHDNRLLSDPNIVYDEADCRGNMAAKTLLRALTHHYIKRTQRNGPFLLQFTDLHASNIFVDEAWNVTCLLDLEWVCSLPSEMLAVPYWLTGCKIDEIKGDRLEEFDTIRREFIRILDVEERKAGTKHRLSLSAVMEEMWESKGVWFWYCIDSVNAMYYLVADHLCPRYGESLSPKVEMTLSSFWCVDSESAVQEKVDELESYQKDLRRVFCEDEPLGP